MRKLLIAALLLLGPLAHAQLLGPTPIPPRQDRPAKANKKQHLIDPEFFWQYGPPPDEGRQHDLIQDPDFIPFLEQNLLAPQTFWGLQLPPRKPLAEVAFDFLTTPGKVLADNNRYMTVTGSVFRRRTSRGLLFVDLQAPSKSRKAAEEPPYTVFAAIDWARDAKTTDEPDAPYTLWIFPPRPGPLTEAVTRSLVRWLGENVPGTGAPQKITATIQVDPDGTPHEIPTPAAPAESPTLPRRNQP